MLIKDLEKKILGGSASHEVCVYIYIYICVCICIYMCVYIYIYITGETLLKTDCCFFIEYRIFPEY